MKSRNPLWYVALMLLFVCVGLMFFTTGVRSVDVVGLFGTGMGCGAALAGILVSLRSVRSGIA